MAWRGENIYKRKDGRWEWRYKNSFRPDGTVIYSSVYCRTYADVKLLLAEKRGKPAENPVPKCLTVQKLFELWFDSIRLTVKESTYATTV